MHCNQWESMSYDFNINFKHAENMFKNLLTSI